MRDDRQRLLDRIVLSQEADRADHGCWIYVTLDEEGSLVNASGPYPSEPDAFLAAEREAVEEADATADGWTQKIIPLWPPS